MNICLIKSKRVPDDLFTPTDGGTINFINIINKLIEEKCNVTVLTRNETNTTICETKIIRNIQVVYLPFIPCIENEIMIKDYYEGLSFMKSVNYFISDKQYDIIHTHHWTSAISLETNSKWVHTPHLLAVAKKKKIGFVCPNFIIEAENLIISKSNLVICLSDAEKKLLINNYFDVDNNKVKVIPNGISELFFYSNSSLRSNKNIKIVTVARHSKQKRLEVIFDTLIKLRQHNYNAELYLIGGEYSENINYYNDIVRYNPNILQHIHFLGYISQEKMIGIYDISNLYVQSSFYESQGIAIYEAMACGLPIITTYQDALKDLIIPNQNGFFFNGSADDLFSKILILFRDYTLWKFISEKNKQKSLLYRWKDTVNMTFYYYKSLLK